MTLLSQSWWWPNLAGLMKAPFSFDEFRGFAFLRGLLISLLKHDILGYELYPTRMARLTDQPTGNHGSPPSCKPNYITKRVWDEEVQNVGGMDGGQIIWEWSH